MKRLATVALLVSVSAFCDSTFARGELIRVDMEGVISSVPNEPTLMMEFETGQPTWLSYEYDSETSDLDASANQGRYPAITWLEGSFAEYSFSSESGIISVEAPGSSDQDILQLTVVRPEISAAMLGGLELTGIYSNLQDSTKMAFPDDSLPTDLDLMDFDFSDIRLRFDDGDTAFFLRSTVSLLTVPEPGGTTALGACLVALAALRRRKEPRCSNSGGPSRR